MSKVLILNGSPRVNGNTSIAIREMENVFRNSGVEVQPYRLEIKISGAVLPVTSAAKLENVCLMIS